MNSSHCPSKYINIQMKVIGNIMEHMHIHVELRHADAITTALEEDDETILGPRSTFYHFYITNSISGWYIYSPPPPLH